MSNADKTTEAEVDPGYLTLIEEEGSWHVVHVLDGDATIDSNPLRKVEWAKDEAKRLSRFHRIPFDPGRGLAGASVKTRRNPVL